MSDKNVTSIEPLATDPEHVTVVFSGSALETLSDLQRRLGVGNREEVVLKGVQLLASARDKEVLLRQGTTTEVVALWPT